MDGLMEVDTRPKFAKTSVDRVLRSAPAKINWNLRVLGKSPDGFHEIESLVSTVSLYDELVFEARPDAEIVLHCTDDNLPRDGSNLVLKAARLLAERSGHDRGVSCRLVKNIPVAGGLGGGSSDAATTLLALSRLWQLDWPQSRLLDLAAELGSDVSFFLTGGSAVIRGRGERVQPVDLPWQGWMVLMLPNWGVSTARVYEAWEPASRSAEEGPAVPRATSDAVEWMSQTFNMLETAAMKVCPALRELLTRAEQLAHRPVRLSGSGSTFFTAFNERQEADYFAEQVGKLLRVTTHLVKPVVGDGFKEVQPESREKMDAPSRM